MKHWTALALLGSLLATAATAHGADAGKATRKAWLRAGIVLDATGKLASIEWLGTRPNDRLVTAPLEAVIRDWEFEPGKVDGVPATTETGLLVHVELRQTAGGGITLHIDHARTGAISLEQTPPGYPRDQLVRGDQAHVLVQVETDGQGQVTAAAMQDYVGKPSNARSRKAFEDAALKAARSWVYRTEQVGGKGVAAVFQLPVTFCIARDWCESTPFPARQLQDGPAPPGVSLAKDSAVTIKTRTSRLDI